MAENTEAGAVGVPEALAPFLAQLKRAAYAAGYAQARLESVRAITKAMIEINALHPSRPGATAAPQERPAPASNTTPTDSIGHKAELTTTSALPAMKEE